MGIKPEWAQPGEGDNTMDTHQLQAFLAVANAGSFSAAAEQLFLTQPAVSKRIALLEQHLGTRLFDRVGRRIYLTPAGQALQPNAETILRALNDAETAIADLSGEVRGPLRLATSHHIGLHRLPPVLREYTRRYPEVNLDLHFLDSEQAYQEVLAGRFDLAVVTLALEPQAHIHSHAIWEDRLHFVAAPGHPLAQKERIGLADLSPYQAIMPDQHTHTTRLVQRLFEQRRQTLDITMVTNHLDTIKMMVSIGLGWGVLPESLLDEQLVTLPVEATALTRPLGSIHHAQRSLGNAAQQFLQLLQEEAGE